MRDTNTDDKCGNCSIDVTYDEDGVCCDKCDKWYHAKCQNIGRSEYSRLVNSSLDWHCMKCRPPQVTSIPLKRKLNKLKIGTLNCRGLKSETKRHHIAEDIRSYNMDILALQETHMGDEPPEEISTIDGRETFMVYHSAKDANDARTRAGTAIVVRKGTNMTFKPISSRLCMMKTKLNNNYTITLINAYAPTLPVSEEYPKVREEFYDELEAVVRSVSKRDYLIILGDFNAKTGKAWKDHQENMGKYGKGELNSNGKELLDFCNRQNLVLTNTLFRHKMAHRTTWESSLTNTESGRRNPYRNQIDYIMTRINQQHTILDSRSHNGLMTFTDHRLVRAKINMRRLYTRVNQKRRTIAIEQLRDPNISAKYAVNVEMKIMDAEDNWNETRPMSAQEVWDMIVKSNHQAAEEELVRKPKRRDHNGTIQALSDQQKELRNKINTTSDMKQRTQLKKQRNQLMNNIHEEIGNIRKRKIEREIETIEARKNDSNRMYTAVRNLQRMQKKAPLVINHESGITTDPQKQIEIVTEFFKDMFTDENTKEIENIPPKKMREAFTEEEVRKAIKSLKNNKSPGVDEIRAEHLKNGPAIVCQKIADILNTTAETGEHPIEIKTGILVPLQKPGKKKGPPANLRPVILLSLLRKILAICLIRRIGERVDSHIPHTQAAYRAGRGTTEQLLTIKLLAEKAATTPNYETSLLMMDMSKAFDRVERQTVLEDLKQILHEDELHMIKILIQDVKLVVKIDKTTGKEFETNIGVPQGDCLSPILFTLYLANAMKEEHANESDGVENHPELPSHLRDHCYSKLERTGVMIPLQYADDICWLGMNCNHSIDNIKRKIPEMLKERNLMINPDKTEEYQIRKDGPEEWKRCKYLGTMLETTEDMKQRKRLATIAMNKTKHIAKDKRLGTDIKIRAFNAYTSSIFLYNSETWTITKNTSNNIDSFHRRMLRNAIDVRWPRKISSEDIYNKTKQRPWSKEITQRRLRLYGHTMRLPEEAPIQQAIIEYERPMRMDRGARKITWGTNIKQDLEKFGLDTATAKTIIQNREQWRSLIRSKGPD